MWQFTRGSALGCWLCLLTLLQGCATDRRRVVLDPIGPVSGAHRNLSGNSTGLLQVYTRTEEHNDGGIMYYPHISYAIYTADGKHVKGVTNHHGTDDQRPTPVDLPSGSYVVYAPSERFGQVKVPVVIVGNHLTAVYLEGAGMPEGGDLPEAARVLLPDGRVAGRRAEETAAPKKP